jgi:antitoxin MazE
MDKALLSTYTQCISIEGPVNTKIQKWGNSLGLRIPKSLAEDTGIEVGTTVDLTVRDGKLVISPARRRYALGDLLRRVTRKNSHSEIDSGDPTGREGW